MPRADTAQLNIRSRFARDRAAALARQTGMTATQVVEEALRAYTPPSVDTAPPGFVRKGPILVRVHDGPTITLEQANAALDAARDERADACA